MRVHPAPHRLRSTAVVRVRVVGGGACEGTEGVLQESLRLDLSGNGISTSAAVLACKAFALEALRGGT